MIQKQTLKDLSMEMVREPQTLNSGHVIEIFWYMSHEIPQSVIFVQIILGLEHLLCGKRKAGQFFVALKNGKVAFMKKVTLKFEPFIHLIYLRTLLSLQNALNCAFIVLYLDLYFWRRNVQRCIAYC